MGTLSIQERREMTVDDRNIVEWPKNSRFTDFSGAAGNSEIPLLDHWRHRKFWLFQLAGWSHEVLRQLGKRFGQPQAKWGS